MSRLQLPYQTAAVLDAATPLQRELLYDTTADRPRTGDGSTLGGKPLAFVSDVDALASTLTTAHTFSSGDSSPSVLGADKFITAGSTAITDFDDAVEGQVIYVFRGDSDIVITRDGTHIETLDGASVTLTATHPFIAFRSVSGVWQEIERADVVIKAAGSAIARTSSQRAADLPNLKDFLQSGETTYNNALSRAFAVNANVALTPGDYPFAPGIELSPGQHIIGLGGARGGSGTGYADFARPRILFTSNGAAGFLSADTDNLLTHGSITNLVIQSDASSQVDYLFDAPGLVGWSFVNVSFQNNWSDGGGFRSKKIDSDSTNWENWMLNCSVRIDDASSKYAFDVDWSDGGVESSKFTGGIGSRKSESGNFSFLGVQFERAKSGAYGLTLAKTNTSRCGIELIGCKFDANVSYGVCIDASGSPSGSTMLPKFIGCDFRNPGATADVIFVDNASTAFTGPRFVGCTFGEDIPPFVVNAAKWKITQAGDHFADTTWLTDVFGDTRSRRRVLEGVGINLDGPIFARASQTFRSQANVAGVFGVNTDASACILLGSTSGNSPFIAASLDSSNVATPLRLRVNNTSFVELTADGANFRPVSNDLSALGSASFSWSDLYLATGGVINWANGGVTITEISDALAFAGAAAGYAFDAPIKMQTCPVYRAQALSAVEVDHTGTTDETTVLTTTLAAGAMGANGDVEIDIGCTTPTSAVIRVKFGGTEFYKITPATAGYLRFNVAVTNQNDASKQIAGCTAVTTFTGFGNTTATERALTIDTTSAVNIIVTVALANGTDHFKLHRRKIMVANQA